MIKHRNLRISNEKEKGLVRKTLPLMRGAFHFTGSNNST